MTMRPLRHLLVAIALLALALPAAGLSASSARAGVERGVVQSVDATSIVLRALDGSVTSFAVPPGTPVRIKGARASLTDIRPGVVASVVYDRQARAIRIDVFGAAATTERGVVTAVARSSITLRTADGASVTVAVDAKTRFRFHGTPAGRQLVRPGAQVAVTHAADAAATVVNVLKRAGA